MDAPLPYRSGARGTGGQPAIAIPVRQRRSGGKDDTPVKKWLAACLWYSLVLMPPASLYKWGWRHRDPLADAEAKGISVRQWMDAVLSPSPRGEKPAPG